MSSLQKAPEMLPLFPLPLWSDKTEPAPSLKSQCAVAGVAKERSYCPAMVLIMFSDSTVLQIARSDILPKNGFEPWPP